MAGLCAPLSTLRQYPRGYLRMTRGRCGSLLLHRDGLAPSTPCRSPGALRFAPDSGPRQTSRACLKRAINNGLMLCSIDQRYSMRLVSMVEQRVWNGNGFRPHQVCKPAFVRAGTETDLVGWLFGISS